MVTPTVTVVEDKSLIELEFPRHAHVITAADAEKLYYMLHDALRTLDAKQAANSKRSAHDWLGAFIEPAEPGA